MLSRITAFSIVLLAWTGCESEPIHVTPATIVEPTAQPVAEPVVKQDPAVLLDLPDEDHALKSLAAFSAIPATANIVVATSDAAAIMQKLMVEPPPPVQVAPQRAPEFLDLHPDRLDAIGLDPAKPVGIAITAERGGASSTWSVFGTIADEDAFVQAFRITRKGDEYIAGAGDLRYYKLLDNNEVVISSGLPPDGTTWLSDDPVFTRLAASLDYGAVLTLYTKTRRGGALAGLGITEDGGAVRVVGTTSSDAATLRLKFPEHLASIYAEVPLMQRALHRRREFDARGRLLRANIEKIEYAALQRRVTAAKTSLLAVEELASLDETHDDLAFASRRWRATDLKFAQLYEGWQQHGPTTEERVDIADLEFELDTLEEDGSTTLNRDDIAKATTKMVEQMAANPQKSMESLGPLGALAGMMGGGDGDGPLGALGEGIGGFNLLGGSAPEPEIIVSSEESHLSRHVRGQLQPLAFCWARADERDEAVRMRVNLEIDVAGAVKVGRVTGPTEMGKCVATALKKKARQPEAPVSGAVTINFRFKK